MNRISKLTVSLTIALAMTMAMYLIIDLFHIVVNGKTELISGYVLLLMSVGIMTLVICFVLNEMDQ